MVSVTPDRHSLARLSILVSLPRSSRRNSQRREVPLLLRPELREPPPELLRDEPPLPDRPPLLLLRVPLLFFTEAAVLRPPELFLVGFACGLACRVLVSLLRLPPLELRLLTVPDRDRVVLPERLVGAFQTRVLRFRGCTALPPEALRLRLFEFVGEVWVAPAPVRPLLPRVVPPPTRVVPRQSAPSNELPRLTGTRPARCPSPPAV